MEIPSLNVSVTKAAVNGQVVDVIEYDEYIANKQLYDGRSDVAIPTKMGDREILLPLKGNMPTNTNLLSPGVYNSGCVDFFINPDEAFAERYVSKNTVTMSNNSDIRDLIIAGEKSKKLDEPFITTPDNITNIPIKDNDQPEMIALKTALNLKHIDLDTYAGRFGDNFPNDKRQLKSNSATLNIIKRYCNNCDIEAVLTLKDKSEDVPNPMKREVSISLTDFNKDEYDNFNSPAFMSEPEDDSDDESEY